MQTRAYGQTGDRLSVIGFGGIVVRDTTPAEAARHVGRALDLGINYFDVAPSYGNSEERLGPALAPHRDQVFLACKSSRRRAADARPELEQSLKRLKTDHFDLYQIHGIPSLEEAEMVLAPGGTLEVLVKARERGLVRHLGFSAHSEAAALRLLDVFPFDSVLFPINLFCWRDGGCGERLCRQAKKQGAAILALKTLARRRWRDGEQKQWPKCWYSPFDTLPEAKAALAFTLAKPVTAAVSPGHAELLWLMCDALAQLGPEPWPEPSTDGMDGAPIFKTDVDADKGK